MKNILQNLLTLLLIVSFITPSIALAKGNPRFSAIEDRLEIQTIMYRAEIYRQYKVLIEDEVSIEEQRLNIPVNEWEIKEWSDFIDKLIDDQIIFRGASAETQKKAKIGLKDSLRAQSRIDGALPVAAYIIGTGVKGVGMLMGIITGSAATFAFFGALPLGLMGLVVTLGLQESLQAIKNKKIYNEGLDYNYFKRHKKIKKRIKKEFKLKKKSLVYSYQTREIQLGSGGAISNNYLRSKNGLLRSAGQFIGLDRKSLSVRNLYKALKKEKLYNKKLHQIRKGKGFTYLEKLLGMLNYVNDNFSEDQIDRVAKRFKKHEKRSLPYIGKKKEVSTWALNVSKVESMKDLSDKVADAPSEVSHLAIVSIIQDFVIPRLAVVMGKGKSIKKSFKCLKKNKVKQEAMAARNHNLTWDSNSELALDYMGYLDSCTNHPYKI